ncbi:LSU ribosomal protein L15p (L27Ae) [hydrothermal vent metagenome]|uniref:LSU ribosomal protein L15p (L27Ae) n=1 Tax=hydrothermal vent metagenome TaxID=652676 RepID=A0A3B1BYS0_9ZZZZ
MKLHELKPDKGSRKKRKVVGRGAGSGHGKTSCRGHNGQNSRAGGGVRAGFEGGQMPLARRLPKYGFTNIFRKEYDIVNLADLERISAEGEVTAETLAKRGVVGGKRRLKVLGNGDITRPLTIKASKFSKTAAEKIEKAGGKALVI